MSLVRLSYGRTSMAPSVIMGAYTKPLSSSDLARAKQAKLSAVKVSACAAFEGWHKDDPAVLIPPSRFDPISQSHDPADPCLLLKERLPVILDHT